MSHLVCIYNIVIFKNDVKTRHSGKKKYLQSKKYYCVGGTVLNNYNTVLF